MRSIGLHILFVAVILNPVVLKTAGGVSTVYGLDGTTPLATKLDSNWRMMTCTLDIGDGEKQYRVPISTTIAPEFCHE